MNVIYQNPKEFSVCEFVNALKTSWKQSIREQYTDLNGLSLFDHHLIKKKIFKTIKNNKKYKKHKNIKNNILFINLIARN